jgi:hypothetical protein
MSDQIPPSGSLTYTRNDSIALPQSGAENRFAIRRSDWLRLQRYVAPCKKDMEPTWSGWYFLCFGVSGSAFLSIVPLSVATGLPTWVVPTYWCVAGATFVLAVILYWISKWLCQQRTDRLDELRKEMSDIEAGFGSLGT